MLNSVCPGKEELLAKRKGYRVVHEIRNLKIFKLKDLISVRHGRLTLRLLMPHIYGAPSKARNANVVYIWTYVWQS